MISLVFWRPLMFWLRLHIEETPYVDYYFTIFTRFFSSEAFDKRTNRVSTDVADKHARYISEIAT